MSVRLPSRQNHVFQRSLKAGAENALQEYLDRAGMDPPRPCSGSTRADALLMLGADNGNNFVAGPLS